MFGQKDEESTQDKVVDNPEDMEEKGKVTWLKLDGKSEIELADTPSLNKKAEELGWKKKAEE